MLPNLGAFGCGSAVAAGASAVADRVCAGTLDFNAELELWTRAGHIKIKVGKAIDVRKLDMLIANVVIGAS